MHSHLPAKKSTSDLVDWLQELGLEKRKMELQKNISTAIADGVIVAEIIHCVYPKLIQLHNYYETHSTQGRKTNWLLLNKKVLKHIRCEATDIEIESFIKRRGPEDAILFLRNLKSRLPAYEPLYLAGHYEVKQPSKRLSTKLRADPTQGMLSQMIPPPPPPESSPSRSKSISSSSSKSTVLSKNGGQPARRSSAAMNDKILSEKKKSADSARRRASELTPSDMDQIYVSLSNRIKTRSMSMAQESEELDQRSAIMDAKFAALRRQNQEDIIKQERRLSVARNEEQEILRGQEVFNVNENDFNYLDNSERAIELKKQLKEEYRRASIALSKYQQNYDEDRDIRNDEQIHDSSGYGQSNYMPYTPPTGGNSIRRSSMQFVDSTFKTEDSPDLGSVTSSISNVSSHASPGSNIKRSPSILYSSSLSTPMNKLKESLYSAATNNAVPKVVKKNASGDLLSPDGVSSEEDSGIDDDSEDLSSDDEDIPPPPPPKIANSGNVVTHIRLYSPEYERHYYVRADDPGGESDWVPPTLGIVQCTDESTGKTFYTQSSTGRTAWNLHEF